MAMTCVVPMARHAPETRAATDLKHARRRVADQCGGAHGTPKQLVEQESPQCLSMDLGQVDGEGVRQGRVRDIGAAVADNKGAELMRRRVEARRSLARLHGAGAHRSGPRGAGNAVRAGKRRRPRERAGLKAHHSMLLAECATFEAGGRDSSEGGETVGGGAGSCGRHNRGKCFRRLKAGRWRLKRRGCGGGCGYWRVRGRGLRSARGYWEDMSGARLEGLEARRGGQFFVLVVSSGSIARRHPFGGSVLVVDSRRSGCEGPNRGRCSGMERRGHARSLPWGEIVRKWMGGLTPIRTRRAAGTAVAT